MNPNPLPTTIYPHIDLSSPESPTIQGTTMKVVELIMAQRAHGWSPVEIHFQFPHISMGQIYAVLAYYWDHQDELDADIERRSRYAEEVRQAAGDSPAVVKLRALKSTS